MGSENKSHTTLNIKPILRHVLILHDTGRSMKLKFIIFVSLQHFCVTEDVLKNWDLWPLITPVLGNISDQCRSASYRYINSLGGAFEELRKPSPQLGLEQLHALQMFDANGPLPFMQEGMLQVYIELN